MQQPEGHETARDDAAHFLDKLLAARPEHAIARLFLPVAKRDAVGAFEAIVFELEQALWHAREPQAAALKLQWWGDELARLLAGEPRHPLTHALVHACTHAREPSPPREGRGAPALAHARESLRLLPQRWLAVTLPLLDDATTSDFTAQRQTVESFYAPLAELEGALLGVGAGSAAPRALSLLLRELGRMACGQEPHRLAVPLNLLARHQLAREALAQDSAAREALLRDQLAALGQAGAASPLPVDANLPVRLRTRLDARLIRRAAADATPSRVLRAAASGVPVATAWHAWRAARRQR